MKLSIIAIGDELLIGQVTDTNSGFIARHIAPMGWEVDSVQVVADDAQAITTAINQAFERTDVVLTTGGLGPTKDDITKEALRTYFGGEMRRDDAVMDNVNEIFRRRGLKMNALTESQAMVPTSARVIQNRVGTAPIMWFDHTDGERVLVAMPGVPFEMQEMFVTEVFPRLLAKYPGSDAVEHRTIMVEGISESALAMRLERWETALPTHIHLAYLPKQGIIRLRLDGHGPNRKILAAEIERYKAELIELCSTNFLYDGDKTPAEILLETAIAQGVTLCTAESCTGGNIAHCLTAIPGSSQAMNGGVVAYSNAVKMALLGVESATLEAHGAVSEPVVRHMAEGARRATDSHLAMATSGIAGPGGGSDAKPVGTVCIAVSTPEGTEAVTFHFPGDRQRVIDRATTTALIMAIKKLRAEKR